MKRWAVGLLLVAGAMLAWWLLGSSDEREYRELAESGAPAAVAGHERRARNLNALLNAPVPQAQGTLAIRGLVVGPDGPLGGAIVTATSGAGDDVLSALPCACDNQCGMKLLECGCGEAAGQLMKLAVAREGEAPPIARTKTASDGSFELTGLEAGSYALWADRSGVGVGLLRSVAAGSEDVSIEIRAGFDIEGTVKDDGDQPVPGALVTAIFAEHSRFFDAIVAEDGSFRIGPVPNGKYSVVASSANLLPDNASTSDSSSRELQLTLSAPRALAGRVVRSSEPVRGATVKLDGEHRKAEVTTGEDGTFRFEGLRPGSYSLVSSFGSEAARSQRRLETGVDLLDVVLDLIPAAGLEVVVTDQTGRPVADAKVSAYNQESYESASARTAAGGRARVSPLEPGTVRFDVSAKGFVPAERRGIELARDATPTITVQLARAALVRGVVFDPAGNPLGGASVTATLKQDAGKDPLPGSSASARTGDDGSFELDELSPGEFEVRASRDGFREDKLSVTAPSEGVELVLGRGGELAGLVVDETDKPVEGVRVVVMPAEPGEHEAQSVGSTTTDREGAFLLSGLPDGAFEVNAIDGGGRNEKPYRRARASTTLSDGVRTALTLKFDKGLSITGTVVDGTGTPVAEVNLTARQDLKGAGDDSLRDSWKLGFGSAVSGPDGSFSIEYLVPGEYLVYAVKKGFTVDRKGHKASAGERNLRLVLEKSGMLSGRVVREDGQPVTRYKLNRRPIEDAMGEFSLPITDSAEVRVLIEPPPGLSTTVRNVRVERGVDLRMPDIVLVAGRSVSGQVVDALTSKPIPGALVDIGTPDQVGKPGYLSEHGGAVRAGADGAYTLPNVENVPRGIFASATGYVMFSKPLATSETTVRIAMMPGGTIRGTVLNGSGSPVPHAYVLATGNATTPGFAQTSEDGGFVLKGLAAGTYQVTVNPDPRDPRAKSAGLFEPKRVEVGAMEEVTVELRARAGRGTLQVTSRAVGERSAVMLVPGDVPTPTSIKGFATAFAGAQAGESNGRFEHLPAGKYSVFLAEYPSGDEPRIRLHRELVSITDDVVKTLELKMPASAPVLRITEAE